LQHGRSADRICSRANLLSEPDAAEIGATSTCEAVMTDAFAHATADVSSTAGASALPGARPGPAGWFAALSESDAAGSRYVLALRFLVINVVAVALLGAAWLKGWVDLILAGDSTHQVLLIAAVFAYGLASCGRKILITSLELDQAREPRLSSPSRVRNYLDSIRGHDSQSRAISASALRMRLMSRIGSIRHVGNSLVFLGLLGTVIGFIMALSGVDAQAAADVESIAPMVTTLIGGMSVALYTTLVGAVLNIWLMINYRLLESGTIALFTAIVELGERHARA
jgi:MotA/TolQ/ExbB proton channel family